MRFFVDFTACPLHDLSESFGFFTWGLLVVGLSVAFCNLSNSCHADSPTLHWCLDLSFFFLSFFLFLSLFYLDELCFVCFVSLLALENLAYLPPPTICCSVWELSLSHSENSSKYLESWFAFWKKIVPLITWFHMSSWCVVSETLCRYYTKLLETAMQQ